MRTNEDNNWLLTKAEQEDGCFISVGAFFGTLGHPNELTACDIPLKVAFSRFLQLARRDRKQTLEQFAESANVDLAELLKIETDDHYTPALRTVHQVAAFLEVPENKLMALAGLLQLEDSRFERESLKFAARSEPVENLTPEEHFVYEEYVKYLCER